MAKMIKNLMILAVAVAPVACGNLSPTSPNEAASAGSSSGTVTSAGARTRPRTSPGTPCAAQDIALTQVGGLRIAAQFVDGGGSPVSSAGCSAIQWNVSPEGAYVQQLSLGAAGEVELIVVGTLQTYTVTASSDALSASIDISPSSVTSAALRARPGQGSSPHQVCAAQGIALTLAGDSRIAVQFVDGGGNPVAAGGCSAIQWNVSPEGAYVRQLSAGAGGEVELIVVGTPQTYTVTASSDALSASIDITF